jgi:predicted N-acetyltransferase YhbS
VSAHFRHATALDAPTITEIINAAYEVENFFKNRPRTDLPEITSLIAQTGYFLLACDDGKVLGNVRLTIDGDRGHFSMLAVRPELKGSGVGARLIAEVERDAAAAGCAWMDLEIVNLRLELPGYYGRFGYEVTGTAEWPADHADRITQPAHFVLMSKRLENAPVPTPTEAP